VFKRIKVNYKLHNQEMKKKEKIEVLKNQLSAAIAENAGLIDLCKQKDVEIYQFKSNLDECRYNIKGLIEENKKAKSREDIEKSVKELIIDCSDSASKGLIADLQKEVERLTSENENLLKRNKYAISDAETAQLKSRLLNQEETIKNLRSELAFKEMDIKIMRFDFNEVPLKSDKDQEIERYKQMWEQAEKKFKILVSDYEGAYAKGYKDGRTVK